MKLLQKLTSALLMRAYVTCVRPLVEYNSIVWSPHTVKDIEAVERVQSRFTKNLPGLRQYSYKDRLCRLEFRIEAISGRFAVML